MNPSVKMRVLISSMIPKRIKDLCCSTGLEGRKLIWMKKFGGMNLFTVQGQPRFLGCRMKDQRIGGLRRYTNRLEPHVVYANQTITRYEQACLLVDFVSGILGWRVPYFRPAARKSPTQVISSLN